MTKIKICGLTRKEEIDFVNEAMPDYVGFVFAESKRRVTPEQARQLKKHLHPDILAVGVFVNEAIETVAAYADEGIIDMIQLHGEEEKNYIKALKNMTKVPVIQAYQAENLSPDKIAESPADYLLFDSGKGSGRTFDWEQIPEIKKNWFLAGGLGEENIEAAIRTLNPYGVDVSSSVETDGHKDREKIAKIVRRIKNGKR